MLRWSRSDQVWVKTEPRDNALVNKTLEEYKFFSLSFSVKPVAPSFEPGPAGTFETPGRDATVTDGESVLGIPDAERGESGTLRLVTRLSTCERHQPATLG